MPSEFFCGFILLLVLFNSSQVSGRYVSTSLRLLRQKRQNEDSTPVVITSPSPEYSKELENFWPKYSERCPDRFMICYDESYCFNEQQLCGGGAGPCLDSSHNINAHCLGKSSTLAVHTTAVAPMQESSTQQTTQTTTTSNTKTETAGKALNIVTHLDSFSHPLVISFFVLVGGLLVYVAMATVCCVTMRMNTISPRPLVAEDNRAGAA